MANISERLRLLRKQHRLSQTELAEKLGMSKGAIGNYELGIRNPTYENLETIADYFNVDLDYLLGKQDAPSLYRLAAPVNLSLFGNISPIEKHSVPMLGEIACGKPIYAEQDRESYVNAGTSVKADFCLKCRGDSMVGARIKDGDIVFCREQPTCENGQIAAVIVNDEATLKRVFYYPAKKKLVLQAENPAYEPLVYVGDELEEVRIIGVAVAFQSDVV